MIEPFLSDPNTRYAAAFGILRGLISVLNELNYTDKDFRKIVTDRLNEINEIIKD